MSSLVRRIQKQLSKPGPVVFVDEAGPISKEAWDVLMKLGNKKEAKL